MSEYQLELTMSIEEADACLPPPELVKIVFGDIVFSKEQIETLMREGEVEILPALEKGAYVIE
jgi:hypothetical protein